MPQEKPALRKIPRPKGNLNFTPGFLELASAGMECLFNEIWRRGVPVLKSYFIGRKGQTPYAAERHAKTTLTNFWLAMKLGKFDIEKTNDGDILPYLVSIANNAFAQIFRDDDLKGGTLRPVKPLAADEIRRDIKLTPKKKDVLQLKQRGYSYREIAEMTGYPVGTVKAIISRARKK